MYVWNEKLQRYQDKETGRIVSFETVYNYVDQSINGQDAVSDVLATLVSEGNLSPEDWERVMREEIKGEYLRQYMLGKGGKENMTPRDWGKVGAMLKAQYAFLGGFVGAIAAGKLSEAQIRARSNLYFSSARQAFETAKAEVAEAWGAKEERWITMPGIEHCPNCLDYEAEGWKPFGYFPMPGDGSTYCGTNCACRKEYRKSEKDGEIYGAL